LFKSFTKFKNKDPFFLFLQKKNKEINTKNPVEQINMIKFVFEEIFKGKNLAFLANDLFKDDLKNPEIYLFYWCILSNRPEIAKAFWILGKVKIFNFSTLKIIKYNFNRFIVSNRSRTSCK
jgi:hypothetical protein